MRYLTLAAAMVLVVGVVSCSENTSAPTAAQFTARPDLLTATTPCDETASLAVEAQQSALFGGPDNPNHPEGSDLYLAQEYWVLVKQFCSVGNPDAANSQLLVYVKFALGLWPSRILPTGDKESNLLAHIDAVYSYVGYPAPALPHSSANGPLGRNGGFKVITQADTETARELRVPEAALTLPVQRQDSGDARAHLFVIYPGASACGTDNLASIGPCYEVAAFPAVSPRFSPKIKVGVCSPVELGQPETLVGNLPALGHLTGGVTEIAGNLNYPDDCGVYEMANTGSWSGGVGAIATRLAWLGKRSFSVNTAYATHSGLGGIGESLSPWIAVDLQVFNAPVDVGPNVLNTFPAAPDLGDWDPASYATAPGSIEVKSSLGNYNQPVIVMRQAGGACSKGCGGLLLRANLFSESGTSASYGRYQISFVAIEDKPAVKEAPFILTDAADAELGRVSFVTRNGKRQLIFNYNRLTGTGPVVGEWKTGVPVNIRFVVNLNANSRSVTLFVGNDGIGNAAPFRTQAATSLAHISFDVRGIDGGTMGWDNLNVQRLSDN